MRECELCDGECVDGLSWCNDCIKSEWYQRHSDLSENNVVCSKCNKKRNEAQMVSGRNYCLVCHGYAWHVRQGGGWSMADYERQYFKSKDNLRKFIR